ncbi:MAG: hypothetical protein KDC05_01740 [Bacteroidales bacterium]|nr:hypothetical protein [Bacteroidales bacterium]
MKDLLKSESVFGDVSPNLKNGSYCFLEYLRYLFEDTVFIMLIVKSSIKIVLTFTVLLFFVVSCERDVPVNAGIDCENCYRAKPEYVSLNAVFTINSENPFVPLTVYVGDVENGEVDWIDTAYQEDYWLDVLPDRYYSVKAKYKDGNNTIFVIDGDKVKLKYTETSCDAACYYKTGGYVDVRLRP